MTKTNPTTDGLVAEWREVPGFPRAFVSSGGGVRGPSGQILKPATNHKGYLQVTLRQKGKARCVTVHSLVAFAFIGPRPPGFHVAHLDGSRDRNSIENLAYVSPAENMRHKLIHGTRQLGERHGKHRLTLEQARAIRDDRRSAGIVAAEYGVCKTTVGSIRRGFTWTAALAESPAQAGEAR